MVSCESFDKVYPQFVEIAKKDLNYKGIPEDAADDIISDACKNVIASSVMAASEKHLSNLLYRNLRWRVSDYFRSIRKSCARREPEDKVDSRESVLHEARHRTQVQEDVIDAAATMADLSDVILSASRMDDALNSDERITVSVTSDTFAALAIVKDVANYTLDELKHGIAFESKNGPTERTVSTIDRYVKRERTELRQAGIRCGVTAAAVAAAILMMVGTHSYLGLFQYLEPTSFDASSTRASSGPEPRLGIQEFEDKHGSADLQCRRDYDGSVSVGAQWITDVAASPALDAEAEVVVRVEMTEMEARTKAITDVSAVVAAADPCDAVDNDGDGGCTAVTRSATVCRGSNANPPGTFHGGDGGVVYPGQECDDGDPCPQSDFYQSGVCTGAYFAGFTAGDQYDDGDPCPQSDFYQSGVCTGAYFAGFTAGDQYEGFGQYSNEI